MSGAASALGIVTLVTASYLIGSIPFAYLIVKAVNGEDVTAHGTGNVGAMNVRRSTGSWGWFLVAMLADFLKGTVPVAITKYVAFGALAAVPVPASEFLGGEFLVAAYLAMGAVAGAVLGHNYSVWMALIKRHFARTGKGLATGAGAVLAYDWRYFLAVVIIGLTVIAVTRYMMAGQVAAAFSLPAAALVLRSPDWPFAVAMGLLVYAAHHKRFIGMLQGREPKLYVDDRMGPRG